ncbi:hypothetical protein HD806DRAFT_543637 [Xylariaceae sp. AK1471]|nr:hypothetical protein HD806DRAFT_543637 [Xylariaceae sp. AK1471]
MAISVDGKNCIIVVAIIDFLATAIVLTRLIVRRKGGLGLDDYILAAILPLLWTESVGADLVSTKGGMGKPMATLTPDEITWFFKMMYWPELGYTILVTAIKISILLSYKRIFGRLKFVSVHIYVLMALTFSWGIGVFFAVLFQCYPIEKVWNHSKPGTCIDTISFLWGNSISNTILDWLILAIPAVPIWKLQMGRAQKTLVACSFAFGSLACIVSVVRAVTTLTLDFNDLSKTVFTASIWTYVEPPLGMIAASLPFLRAVLGNKILRTLEGFSTLESKAREALNLRSSETQASNGLYRLSESKNVDNNITKHITTTVLSSQRSPAEAPFPSYSVQITRTDRWNRGSAESFV